jgi:hypothetical protein
MGALAKRYKEEYLPKLARSTQDTDTSTIKVHILPRWEKTKLTDIPSVDWKTEATLSQQRDMMRHADIGTTLDYGGTPLEEMRPLHEAAAIGLKLKLP